MVRIADVDRIEPGRAVPASLGKRSVNDAFHDIEAPILGKRSHEGYRWKSVLAARQVQSVQPPIRANHVDRPCASIDRGRCGDAIGTNPSSLERAPDGGQAGIKLTAPNRSPIRGVQSMKVV